MQDRLHLVGSIPLDTVAEVFKTFGEPLGPYLRAMPDGEVGPRRHWISRVHYQVFAGHQDFEVLRRPRPEAGVERLFPRDASDSWLFRVRPGVERVRFGEPGWRLGFARDAIHSYFVFRTLRDKGLLAPHLKFQVSLASVLSTLPPRIFPEPGDLARIAPGYEQALCDEVANIAAHIPHADLAVQWDCVHEVQDAYGAIPGQPPEGVMERNTRQFRALAAALPGGVDMGFHFCFGTLGGWPRFSPASLDRTVELANACVESAGRRVDWLHLPVLDTLEEAFYAPLAHLQPRGARVYLGLIHNMARFAQRTAMARRFLPDFGYSTYCGLGRHAAQELPQVLAEHLQAMESAV